MRRFQYVPRFEWAEKMFHHIKAGKKDFTGNVQKSDESSIDAHGIGDNSDADIQIPDKEKKPAKDKGTKKEKKPKASEQTLDTSQLLKKKDDRNI